ncbi:terminase small subunit [Spirulina subsalsa FACHB-351]|uniref:Terminase small subunit n=1 Tax=Spirulina subsalsa FACHB-351 TaxID=234711 RepID=A0ABT3L5M0_9CYAN|nr:terminase small subunit [Spirulina subsalsa]MCW6036813.1 terminase small subunit [Spirulina subsalsa FACHB-351]
MGEIVSKKMFAKMVGKSDRWIGKWIDEGMPVAGGGGKGRVLEIDTEDAIDWLIRREVRRQFGDEDDEDEDGVGSASSEDRMLKKARREKLQIEIDTARRRLVPVDAVEAIMMRFASIFATQIDAIASRVASDMATIDDPAEARHRLLIETRRVRAATADGIVAAARQLGEEVDSLDLADGEDGDGAAAEDG